MRFQEKERGTQNFEFNEDPANFRMQRTSPSAGIQLMRLFQIVEQVESTESCQTELAENVNLRAYKSTI